MTDVIFVVAGSLWLVVSFFQAKLVRAFQNDVAEDHLAVAVGYTLAVVQLLFGLFIIVYFGSKL